MSVGLGPRRARTIYQDRAGDRMPNHADPLEEAGCAADQALGHLRGRRPHLRGCWVIDLLTGATPVAGEAPARRRAPERDSDVPRRGVAGGGGGRRGWCRLAGPEKLGAEVGPALGVLAPGGRGEAAAGVVLFFKQKTAYELPK